MPFKQLLIVSAAALVLAACGSGDAGDAAPQATSPTSPQKTVEEKPTAPPEGRVAIEVTVEDGEVKTTSDELEASLGERVEIAVTSDQDDEVHVHGYDLSQPVAAGSTATVRFTADIPGVFEVELEDSHLTLFELRVE